MLFFSLTLQEKKLLQEFVLQTVLSNEARRAQALLWLDAGESPQVVAVRLRTSRQTVYNWATRFKRRQSESDICVRLADGKRSGRPRTRLTAVIDTLIADAMTKDPHTFGYAATSWSGPLLDQYLREIHHLTVNYTSVKLALQRVRRRGQLFTSVEERPML